MSESRQIGLNELHRAVAGFEEVHDACGFPGRASLIVPTSIVFTADSMSPEQVKKYDEARRRSNTPAACDQGFNEEMLREREISA